MPNENDIAVIGYYCRVPGANSAQEFWNNLCSGKEALIELPEEANDNQINKVMAFDGATEFDASFFEYSRREAELLDPQQRIFLEACWHAIEMAGYAPNSTPGLFGIYAGCAFPTYLLDNIDAYSNQLSHSNKFQLMLANDKDYLATRVAYKLNLLGQAITVQTACSTSLVALHQACQALLNGEVDGALAGGVSIHFPQRQPYIYQEGMILSQDGHCRPFADDASGTVIGDGVGLVVLKRYEDAIRDKDTIYAIVKGTAINNDGHRKVSFIAPNINSQVAVISEALAIANVDASSITYIETHGTGTKLGDPIELEALKTVFAGNEPNTCAIGSVKANIGHLNCASGIVGAIKVIMALQHGQIPPQINCERLNSACSLNGSPLYINKTSKPWTSNTVRRAGVSSFGFGGTNAHAILEQAPPPTQHERAKLSILGLKISAKSNASLFKLVKAYLDSIHNRDECTLGDFCYTANVGRSDFSYRLFITASDKSSLINQLLQIHQSEVAVQSAPDTLDLTFHFSHQIRYFSKILETWLLDSNYKKLYQRYLQFFGPSPTDKQQLFSSQFALARYFQRLGATPLKVSGQGVGLLVAACYAECLSIEDAVALLCSEIVDLQIKNGVIALQGYEDSESLKLALLNNSEVIDDDFSVKISLNNDQYCIDNQNADLLTLLGCFYRSGIDLNWNCYYEGLSLYRISIPTFPFEREDFCLNKLEQQGVKKIQVPLLHRLKLEINEEFSKQGAISQNAVLIVFTANEEQANLFREVSSSCLFLIHDISIKSEVGNKYYCDFNQEGFLTYLDRVVAQYSHTNTKIYYVHALSVSPVRMDEFDADELIETQKLTYNALLKVGQHLSKSKANEKLWLLSQGLTVTNDINPLHSPLSGLSAVMAIEIPEVWGGHIDVDLLTFNTLKIAFSTIQQAKSAIQVSVVKEEIYQPKLLPIKDISTNKLSFQDGIYIIAGGSGGVGQLIVQQLIDLGARHLILVSRGSKELKHFSADTVKIDYVQADVANFNELSIQLTKIAGDGTIKGVFQLAGVLDDALLVNQSYEKYQISARAKVAGSWNLHRLSVEKEWPLDYFVMFSSITSLFGNWGQANYASTNSFQNCLSRYRQQLGRVSTSILLGKIADTGMSDGITTRTINVAHSLIPPLNKDNLLGALNRVYQLSEAEIVVQPIDMGTLPLDRLNPIQQKLLPVNSTRPNHTIKVAFREIIDSLPEYLKLERITDWLHGLIAEKLNHKREELSLNTGFNELGLDSLMAIDVKEIIDRELAINLPIAAFFNSSTVIKLGQSIYELYLLNKLEKNGTDQSKGNYLPVRERKEGANNLDDENELMQLIDREFEKL